MGDFADLNHSEVPPSIKQYQHAMNGMPFNMGPSMSNIQNNQSSFKPIMNNNQSKSAHHSHHHTHTHNQTGSNYDELPLEFIHNIPQNNANNANNNVNNMASGYQEIEFNDHDDAISSVPSMADSYN